MVSLLLNPIRYVERGGGDLVRGPGYGLGQRGIPPRSLTERLQSGANLGNGRRGQCPGGGIDRLFVDHNDGPEETGVGQQPRVIAEHALRPRGDPVEDEHRGQVAPLQPLQELPWDGVCISLRAGHEHGDIGSSQQLLGHRAVSSHHRVEIGGVDHAEVVEHGIVRGRHHERPFVSGTV